MTSRWVAEKIVSSWWLLLPIGILHANAFAQWEYPTLLVPMTISDGVHSVADTFGCHGRATYCIDGLLDSNLFETELPDPIPTIFDARFVDHRGGSSACLGTGVRLHLQEFWSADTFWLNIRQLDTALYPITLTWSHIQGFGNEFWSDLFLMDRVNGTTINVDMRAENTVEIPNQLYSNLQIIGFSVLAGVDNDRGTIPSGAILYQNYPNPFNGTTIIEYFLPVRDRISLTVYDQLGRVVLRILERMDQPGLHTVQFKPPFESSGQYFYRLESSNFNQTKSFIFLK